LAIAEVKYVEGTALSVSPQNIVRVLVVPNIGVVSEAAMVANDELVCPVILG